MAPFWDLFGYGSAPPPTPIPILLRVSRVSGESNKTCEGVERLGSLCPCDVLSRTFFSIESVPPHWVSKEDFGQQQTWKMHFGWGWMLSWGLCFLSNGCLELSATAAPGHREVDSDPPLGGLGTVPRMPGRQRVAQSLDSRRRLQHNGTWLVGFNLFLYRTCIRRTYDGYNKVR